MAESAELGTVLDNQVCVIHKKKIANSVAKTCIDLLTAVV